MQNFTIDKYKLLEALNFKNNLAVIQISRFTLRVYDQTLEIESWKAIPETEFEIDLETLLLMVRKARAEPNGKISIQKDDNVLTIDRISTVISY